jgi:hypothetical protein
MEPGAQEDVRLTDQLQVTLARSQVHLRHPHHVPKLFIFLYFFGGLKCIGHYFALVAGCISADQWAKDQCDVYTPTG